MSLWRRITGAVKVLFGREDRADNSLGEWFERGWSSDRGCGALPVLRRGSVPRSHPGEAGRSQGGRAPPAMPGRDAVPQAALGAAVEVMGGYDELDRLFDVDPLAVLHRCREAERRLAELEGDGKHRIKLDGEGWVLRHPLACRESGDLFDCPYNTAAADIEADEFPHGEYVVRLSDGRLVFL